MIGGRALLVVEMHLIKDVYNLDPSIFYCINCVSNDLMTSLLTPMPSIIPALSMLYLFKGLIAWIRGRARWLN